MDTNAFDRLTRRFGARVSRRRLSLSGAGLLALVGVGLSQEEASARCRKPGVKCKDACCRGTKICRKGRCVTCQGFRCPDGRCLAQSCGGACCPKGQTCCDGTCCTASETCCDGVCCPQGRTCCSGVCCAANETCVGEFCSPCTTLTNSCDVETRCGPNDDFRCATSVESGNYCVHFGFLCTACSTDEECVALEGFGHICVSCPGCPGEHGCARILVPA